MNALEYCELILGQNRLAVRSIEIALGKPINRAGSAIRLLPAVFLVLSAAGCAGSNSNSLQPADPVLTADRQATANAAELHTASDTEGVFDVGSDANGVGEIERQTDKDSDGVTDSLDACADTRALYPVDTQGCDLFAGKLENVEFKPDAYDLNEASKQALDQLVERMQEHPDVVLAVSGHTDNRGNARYNLELSKKRVLAVVHYLVRNGINGRRLLPHGYGESRPLFSNATDEGRGRNRRIEVTLVASN